MSKVKFAIAGCGGRGRNTYGRMFKYVDNAEIAAIADINFETLSETAKEFGIPAECCYSSAEEMLVQDKLADVMIIATPDDCHADQAVTALEKGYHLLLEKPIATTEEDCRRVLEAQRRSGKMVVVCHVLRYAPFYQTIKGLIDDGVIGDVVTLNGLERVCYWHQAHSYVRGNWRRLDESSPMILAKCCHDMDIVSWLVGKRCLSVSSYGSLSHFTESNAPEGSTDRCSTCPVKDCKYNAYNLYLPLVNEEWTAWPANILSPIPDKEHITEAIETGPYGRCVYRCDNDVVDHQVVNMLFEDGVTANYTMTAFTATEGRSLNVMGTEGEIRADMNGNFVRVMPFGKDEYTIDISKVSKDSSGHGGGDMIMFADFINAVESGVAPRFELTQSIESHLIAFAAERSRLNDGAPEKIHI